MSPPAHSVKVSHFLASDLPTGYTQLLLGSHCEGVCSGAFDLGFITQYRLGKQMRGKLGEGEGT